jgi:ABC-2 type transport system permease protein
MSTTQPQTTRPQAAADRTLHAALSSSARPRRPSAFSAAKTFGWRGMLKIKHVPEQLIDVTLTPVLFLVMFTYLFGGAMSGSTSEYLQFILPGILVQSVLFTAVYSGVALNTDMTKGVVDRFRSLPIWRAAPLVGAVIGDCVRFAIASTIVVALGFALGFDAEGGILGVLGAMLLVIVFSFALSWVFTTLGLVLRSPSAVMNSGFMALFPLVFLSNTLVDPTTLPSALEAFVNVNPVSSLVTAARGLMAGDPSAGDIGLVLAEAGVLVAVFAPLTVRLYRGKG